MPVAETLVFGKGSYNRRPNSWAGVHVLSRVLADLYSFY